MTTLLGAALDYAERGWKVFPLWWPVGVGRCACWLGDQCSRIGKHPLLRSAHPKGSAQRTTCRGECGRDGHGLWDATDNPERVDQWWRRAPRANIGINCGESGLAVLDVDPHNGGSDAFARLVAAVPLPTTVTSLTGGGGRHHIYAGTVKGAVAGRTTKHPAFGSDMHGLDIKSVGGYIVAPPSGHASGTPYQWANDQNLDHPLASWPELLTRLRDRVASDAAEEAQRMRQPTRGLIHARRTSGVDRAQSWLANIIDDYLAVPANMGQRNDALNTAAYRAGRLVARGHIAEGEARRALESAAASYARKDGWHAAAATIESGYSAGLTNTRHRTPAAVT